MKQKSNYIRSTKTNISFANDRKRSLLSGVQTEYTNVVNQFVEMLWMQGLEKIPSLLPKEYTNKISSWLSARLIQCAGKQASGIVRGVFAKQKRRIYVYNKLIVEGKSKQSSRLKKVIDSFTSTIPHFDSIPMELDSRFVTINTESSNSFDLWINLSSLGNKVNLKLPSKKTKHFNKFYRNPEAKMLSGVRIDGTYVIFMFEVPIVKKIHGTTLGLDIGSLNVYTTSDGQQSEYGLSDIQKKIARRKKGSRNYEQSLIERQNFINRSINRLNLNGVKTLRRENIKYMKKGVRLSKFLTSWTYTNIFDKLDRYCEEMNVSVIPISPTYTSQRCSKCGWTRKSNRKGKIFKCDQCGNTEDSDLNASKNIALNLKPIGKKERLLQPNRTGFYWIEVGEEHIVPSVQESIIS